jgi:serine/threonine protein kinase
VLELVDGPTLAERISEGAVPLDEALPIARQIAEALDAAHEQGIIHRDLKPANIKLGTNRDFDMFPDGNRFVAAVASGGRTRDIRQFEVVPNWIEELKQRVATN